jgi:hypothetical protein
MPLDRTSTTIQEIHDKPVELLGRFHVHIVSYALHHSGT